MPAGPRVCANAALNSRAIAGLRLAPTCRMTQQSPSPSLRPRYDNFIAGTWQPPARGRYFTDTSPIDGSVLCEVALSDASDVERALDAAHAARAAWGRTAPAERARILHAIADRIDANRELIATIE